MQQKDFSQYLDDWIFKHQDAITSSLLELIAIPSVELEPQESMPFGPEVAKAIEMFLDKANSFGFVTRNVDGYAAHAEIGSGDKLVMALTHVDIVPFGTGWTKDPKGEIKDGNIFGRGTQDDKGPTIAVLYALKAIKDSGLPLSARIRHVVGGNEESGFRCVKHYFEIEEKPDYGFSPDASFPLVYAEKGSMTVEITVPIKQGPISVVEVTGGEKPNIVPEYAKAVLNVPKGEENAIVDELKTHIPKVKEQIGGPGPLKFDFSAVPGTVNIECEGLAAHSSVPWEGTNALAAVLLLVSRLGDRLGSQEAIEFAARAANIYGKGLNIESEDDISGKLSCSLGICTTSESDGSKLLTGIYNIRYPVTIDGKKLRSNALGCETPKGSGIRIKVPRYSRAHYTDPESFLVKTLLRVYREETGDNSEPIAIGGGTYARVIPGGVAYGPVRPGAPALAHQADEFISLEDLFLSVKIYARAMYELAK